MIIKELRYFSRAHQTAVEILLQLATFPLVSKHISLIPTVDRREVPKLLWEGIDNCNPRFLNEGTLFEIAISLEPKDARWDTLSPEQERFYADLAFSVDDNGEVRARYSPTTLQ